MNSDIGTRGDALRQGKALLVREPNQALEQAQAMIAVDARDPDAHLLAAKALRQLGRTNEAEASFEAALNHWQATPQLRAASAALAKGEKIEAEAQIRDRLASEPADGSAKMMLAEIAISVGRVTAGEALLREVLADAPAFKPARTELVKLLSDRARNAEALVENDILISSDPDNLRWQRRRISLLTHLSRFEEALELCEAVLSRHPNDVEVLISRGNILKTLNRAGESVASYRAAIAQDNKNGVAWWSLANVKTVRFDDADLAALRDAAGAELAPKVRTNALFALATALEQRKEHAAAFEAYRQGNETWRANSTYHPEATADRVDNMISAMNADWFAAVDAYSAEASGAPIFILGMPRAGSTLLEQILSSHSLIEGTAELPYVPAMALSVMEQIEQESLPEAIAGLGPEARSEFHDRYLASAALHRRTDRQRFIDKTPANWFYLPFILGVLPNAKIIDARRDAMACCFSNFKQHFAHGALFSYDLAWLGRYYRDYVRLMDHIHAVAPGRICTVHYENVVADLETEVRRVLDYLELPFEESCLHFHENERAVRTPSAEQVRRPIQRDGNEAWKPFAPWLDELREALGPLASE